MRNEMINKAKYLISMQELHGDYRDNTLAEGIPAKLLLISSLKDKYKECEYESIVDKNIDILINSLETYGLYNFSLFSGTAGVGLSLFSVSANGNKYNDILNSIHTLLVEQVEDFFKFVKKSDLKIIDYDLITGISGIVQYLLLWTENEILYETLIKCLDFLVSIVLESKTTKLGKVVPCIFISAENQMTKEEASLIPNGAINLGVAHGIAGIGIALCLAYINGIKVKYQREAIDRIITIYKNNELRKEEKIYWNNNLEPSEISDDFKNFIRDGWCYGVPGISLFFLYSGLVFKNNEYIEYAKKLFKNSLKNLEGVYSPILCHGYSGLAEIANVFCHTIGDKELYRLKNDLNKKVVSFFDVNSKYGFKDFEDCKDTIGEENIGFLDGAIGIYLSIFDNEKEDKVWSRALLL